MFEDRVFECFDEFYLKILDVTVPCHPPSQASQEVSTKEG
jgi:hypothetical protein